MLYVVFSWVAVALGLTGFWMAAKHRVGWLIALACNAAWVVVDVHVTVWAAVFSCVVQASICLRNYFLRE